MTRVRGVTFCSLVLRSMGSRALFEACDVSGCFSAWRRALMAARSFVGSAGSVAAQGMGGMDGKVSVGWAEEMNMLCDHRRRAG